MLDSGCGFDAAAGRTAVAGTLEAVTEAAGTATAASPGAVWTCFADVVEAVVGRACEAAPEPDETGAGAVVGDACGGVSDGVVAVAPADGEPVVAAGGLELGVVVVGPPWGALEAPWALEPLGADPAVPGPGAGACAAAAGVLGVAGADVDELVAGALAAAGVVAVAASVVGELAVVEDDADELVAGGVDAAALAAVGVVPEAEDGAGVDAALVGWLPADGVPASVDGVLPGLDAPAATDCGGAPAPWAELDVEVGAAAAVGAAAPIGGDDAGAAAGAGVGGGAGGM